MSDALRLGKYSFGVGDRFAHQAKAQLRACAQAAARGVEVTPVWNKSHREHTIVGSRPPSVLAAARAAVRELDWTRPFHVDADHIRLDTVDEFVDTSDFYTLDVADSIGEPADGTRRSPGDSRHRRAFRDDARRDRAHRLEVPQGRARSGAHLPPRRRA